MLCSLPRRVEEGYVTDNGFNGGGGGKDIENSSEGDIGKEAHTSRFIERGNMRGLLCQGYPRLWQRPWRHWHTHTPSAASRSVLGSDKYM